MNIIKKNVIKNNNKISHKFTKSTNLISLNDD